MAVHSDVMELVRLLDAEGFSVIAGEILTEIALGRENPSQEFEGAKREAIPEDEQLRAAIDLLKLRLTEPARRLAEAEEIAAALSDGEAVPIVFVDMDGNIEWKAEQGSAAQPGGRVQAIAALEQGLERLVRTQSGLA